MKSAVFECTLADFGVNEYPDGVDSKMEIITANEELQVEWFVRCEPCEPYNWDDPPFHLKKIKLRKHNKSIFGNIVIKYLNYELDMRDHNAVEFESKVITFEKQKSEEDDDEEVDDDDDDDDDKDEEEDDDEDEDEECDIYAFKVKVLITINYADGHAPVSRRLRVDSQPDKDVPRKKVKYTHK